MFVTCETVVNRQAEVTGRLICTVNLSQGHYFQFNLNVRVGQLFVFCQIKMGCFLTSKN